MKKAIVVFLSVIISLSFFSACSKKGEFVKTKELKPTETIKAEDVIPKEKFIGIFKNDEYTMTVEETDDDQMHVTIKSTVKNKVGYEWEIYALFSENTYRINYTDAVKTIVNFDKNGKETERKTEYENGVGRIQFEDVNILIWENSLDNIENNKLTRK